MVTSGPLPGLSALASAPALPALPPPPPAAEEPASEEKAYLRKKTAIGIFREELISARKRGGVHEQVQSDISRVFCLVQKH